MPKSKYKKLREKKEGEESVEIVKREESRGFFTYFDDSHFENKKLPKMIEENKTFEEMFKEKNIFNKALLSDLNSDASTNSGGNASNKV